MEFPSVQFCLVADALKECPWSMRPLIGSMGCLLHLPCPQRLQLLLNTKLKQWWEIHLPWGLSLVTILVGTWSTGWAWPKIPSTGCQRFSMWTGSVLMRMASFCGQVSNKLRGFWQQTLADPIYTFMSSVVYSMEILWGFKGLSTLYSALDTVCKVSNSVRFHLKIIEPLLICILLCTDFSAYCGHQSARMLCTYSTV